MVERLDKPAVNVLASGGWYFECPRWRDGLWWVSDICAGKVCTFDEAGTRTDIMEVSGQPSGLGWLPDGSLLVVSMNDRKILRRTDDGTVTVHADLSGLLDYELNDMVVAASGHAFVGTIGFDIAAGEDPRSGAVYLIEPDGSSSVAADDLWCPNGMVISEDGSTLIVAESFAGRLTAFDLDESGKLTNRRVFAQIGEQPPPGALSDMFEALKFVPDGLAIDAEGAVWAADPSNARVVRLDADGALVTELVDADGKGIQACGLGGSDGRTLLLCTVTSYFAAISGIDTDKAVLKTTRVTVPHAGRP